jgi:coproporphyrinogen III oxidase-like Fe-S oxidoreductase
MNERKWNVNENPKGAAPDAIAETRVGVGISRLLSNLVLTPYLKKMTGRYLRLEPVQIDALPGPRAGRTYTLYLHVPFCESLCPYCSFNRFLFDEEKARGYYRRLREEMRMAHRLGYRFVSLYIGGGTPTILVDELCQTIDLARELFPIGEVSCETNPNHLIPEVIEQLKGRVQRLSVGVQSFDDTLLKEMARYQKFGSGAEIQEKIRAAAPHFPSLNVDMIYNFPNQTEEILRNDIRMVIESGAQQTTFYPLMTSNSVEKSLDRSVGKVNYGREAAFYQVVLESLRGSFQPMSAWTFLRDGTGMLDEYIVDSEEYVGLGSGAFSFLDGALYVNTFSPREYARAIDAGRMSVSARQRYGRREQMRYRFMMELFGLRFDRQRFRRSFGMPAELGLWLEMLFMLLVGGFSKTTREAIFLTPRGRYLSVVMMREFFSGVNNVRDEARKALSADERQCAFPLKGKQLTYGGD